jgi:RNA polymerase sigma factor (sigma-70 family)
MQQSEFSSVIRSNMKRNQYSKDLSAVIEACRKGESKAQLEVYKRYYKAMYNVALRILNNAEDAEDVMQESFLSAFQKLDTWREDVSFGAWLKKIVINRSLDVIRTRKALISLDAVPEMTDESEEEYLNYRDIRPEMIAESIATLPDGYRVILSLYLIEGYDHEEISKILHITNATSRTQYHRAKKHLAEKLKEKRAVS